MTNSTVDSLVPDSISACERLGPALEQRLQRVRNSEDAELDSHLATCADCRDYVQRAERVELELTQTLNAPVTGPGWSEIRKRMETTTRIRIVLFASAMVMALLGIAAVAFNSADWGIGVMSLVIAVIFFASGVREGRLMSAATEAPGGLFTWARKEAKQERLLTVLSFLWLAATALTLTAALMFGSRDDDFPYFVTVPAVMLQMGIAIFAVRRFFELRRELDALT